MIPLPAKAVLPPSKVTDFIFFLERKPWPHHSSFAKKRHLFKFQTAKFSLRMSNRTAYRCSWYFYKVIRRQKVGTALERGSLDHGRVASSPSVWFQRLLSVIYVNALFSEFSFFHKLLILWPRTDLSPLWNLPSNLPPSPNYLFIKEHGRHPRMLLCLVLWWQASLTKIKELPVLEGWTLWSQPPKEKCPQREVQSMSVTSSFIWEMGSRRLSEHFYREAVSKLQIRLVFCLLLWMGVANGSRAVCFKKELLKIMTQILLCLFRLSRNAHFLERLDFRELPNAWKNLVRLHLCLEFSRSSVEMSKSAQRTQKLSGV